MNKITARKAENRQEPNCPTESMLETDDKGRESRVVSCKYNNQSDTEDL